AVSPISLPDALPICRPARLSRSAEEPRAKDVEPQSHGIAAAMLLAVRGDGPVLVAAALASLGIGVVALLPLVIEIGIADVHPVPDRKSTRLNSSHVK